MKLFFDEDLGKGLPEALRGTGALQRTGSSEPITYVRRAFHYVFERGGTVPDEMWIPWAGERGYLVVSCNRAILESDAQRALLQEHNVGAIFFTTGRAPSFNLLRLILRKWEWLQQIDRTVPRPFAYLMPPSGRKPQLDPRLGTRPL